MNGVTSDLDSGFYFGSIMAPDQEASFKSVLAHDWDPCQSRQAPTLSVAAAAHFPALWHATDTYTLPSDNDQQFVLHKDHYHKDILECAAPLIRHPLLSSLETVRNEPRSELVTVLEKHLSDDEEMNGMISALKKRVEEKEHSHLREPPHMNGQQFDSLRVWSHCFYTNMINQYATDYKKRFCDAPNVDRTQPYPARDQAFLRSDSRLKKIFSPGGWTDPTGYLSIHDDLNKELEEQKHLEDTKNHAMVGSDGSVSNH
jgi:hypothetical protein